MSLSGVVYGLLMVFMCVAAVNTQANLLFAVLGLMVGILLVSFVLSRLVLSRIEVRRMLPPHAIAGRPVTVSYAVRNAKRFWPMFSVTVTELDAVGDEGVALFDRRPLAYALHAAPRMTAVVPVTLTPRRRGIVRLGRYQVSTSFPFGFIRRARQVVPAAGEEQELLVFPPMGEVAPRLVAAMRSAESTGRHVRPRPGGQDEFFGTREYRPGDPPRTIHWRRSASALAARTPLVTKEMTHVSPPRLLVVVDHDAAPEPAERAVAVAASLVDAALSRHLRAGVVVWGEDGPDVLTPDGGKRHRREALTTLARLPARGRDRTVLMDLARQRMRREDTLILVTPDAPSPMSGDGTGDRPLVVSAAAGAGLVSFDDAVEFGVGAHLRERDEEVDDV